MPIDESSMSKLVIPSRLGRLSGDYLLVDTDSFDVYVKSNDVVSKLATLDKDGLILGIPLADVNLPLKGSADTAGTSSATTGATIEIPYLTTDAYGRVTAKGTHTHTVKNLPASAISSGTIAEARIPSDYVKAYGSGDTITGHARCVGWCTAGGTVLRFEVPVNRPINGTLVFGSMTITARADSDTITITPNSSQMTIARDIPGGILFDYTKTGGITGMSNNQEYAMQVNYTVVVS